MALLLVILFLLGSCAAFRAYSEYVWAGLFTPTVTRLDSLTPEQTELLAEHFGLRGEDLGDVTEYYSFEAPQASDCYIIFTAQADPVCIRALTENNNRIYTRNVPEGMDWKLRNGVEINYTEMIDYEATGVYGTRIIYHLRDGSGYIFYATMVPDSLRFCDAETHIHRE